MNYDAAHRLASEIRASEEYTAYHRLREEVMEDETQAALIKEYKKLQARIQMAALAVREPEGEDMTRFSGISSLLFTKPEVAQYLMSEMQLQQAMADIFKIITEAADIDLGLPTLP